MIEAINTAVDATTDDRLVWIVAVIAASATIVGALIGVLAAPVSQWVAGRRQWKDQRRAIYLRYLSAVDGLRASCYRLAVASVRVEFSEKYRNTDTDKRRLEAASAESEVDEAMDTLEGVSNEMSLTCDPLVVEATNELMESLRAISYEDASDSAAGMWARRMDYLMRSKGPLLSVFRADLGAPKALSRRAAVDQFKAGLGA